jgi:hypothetical protein
MPVSSEFINKIMETLETNSRDEIRVLCKVWTEMYGPQKEFALEVQLGPMIKEFFSDILAENTDVQKTLTDGIEGKFS